MVDVGPCGKPKITNNEVEIISNKYIFRLKISMHDSLQVKIGYCIDQLVHEESSTQLTHFLCFFDEFKENSSRYVF
jgi:hypothetical protein